LGNTPKKYQPMSFRGKNMKRGREKGGNCERKRKEGDRKLERGQKGRKGKEKESKWEVRVK
jgi:hypothetical protein